MTQCAAPDLQAPAECLFSDWTGSQLETRISKLKTRDMRHFWLPFWLFGLFAQPLQNRNLEPKSRDWDREMGPEVAQTIPGSNALKCSKMTKLISRREARGEVINGVWSSGAQLVAL